MKMLESLGGRYPPTVVEHLDYMVVVIDGAGVGVEFVHGKEGGVVSRAPGIQVGEGREFVRRRPVRESGAVGGGCHSGGIVGGDHWDGDVNAVFGKGGIKGLSKAILERRERGGFGLGHNDVGCVVCGREGCCIVGLGGFSRSCSVLIDFWIPSKGMLVLVFF